MAQWLMASWFNSCYQKKNHSSWLVFCTSKLLDNLLKTQSLQEHYTHFKRNSKSLPAVLTLCYGLNMCSKIQVWETLFPLIPGTTLENPSQTPKPDSTLIFGLLRFQNYGKQVSLLYNLPNLWYSVIAAQTKIPYLYNTVTLNNS